MNFSISKFVFGSSSLDDRNWVVDFGGLKDLKSKLQDQFDHTLCVAANDPQLDLFKKLHDVGACQLRVMPDGVGIEKTAEFCFNVANEYITSITNNRCWVDSVEVFEHEFNSAIYKRNDKNVSYNSSKDTEYVLLEENLNLS